MTARTIRIHHFPRKEVRLNPNPRQTPQTPPQSNTTR